MDCKDFVLNDGSDWKVIEYVCKILPNKSVSILGLTLHVKAIILSDSSGLMISSDHMHLCWILDFEQA